MGFPKVYGCLLGVSVLGVLRCRSVKSGPWEGRGPRGIGHLVIYLPP